MAFDTELVAQQTGDFEWTLVQDLVYSGRRDTYTVPTGFDTDFASIPIPFQWLLPRSGRYTKPAVLHDYLRRHGKMVDCSVGDADGLFRRAMADVDVPFLTRWVMWTAVRVFSPLSSWLHQFPLALLRIALCLIPGVLVLLGGVVVIAMLLAWFFIECVATFGFEVFKRLAPRAVKERLKPSVAPTISAKT